MKKTFLVIGADGFLGRRVADYYEEKYEVIRGIHKEIDITNEESVNKAFLKYRPDLVINCAAISAVNVCEEDKVGSRLVNVDGSINIAKASLLVNAKCVFCSSDQVYFEKELKKGLHQENEILCPINEYGRQKIEAEKEVLFINKDAVFLRLSWMYDVIIKSATEHSNFMQNLIRQIRNQENIMLATHDIRGITDVNEVVKNLEKAFSLQGGIYNFGSSNEWNMYETMCEVYNKLGWTTERLEINEKAFTNNPRNMGMALNKVNQAGIYFQNTTDALVESLREICYCRNIDTLEYLIRRRYATKRKDS